MASYWILKTEPDSYSFEDLVREGTGTWDGVANAVALKHIGAMRTGDRLLIYHTGREKQVVGAARIVSDPYPDPKSDDPKLMVFDLTAGSRWPSPVSLSTIKADPLFADHPLVRVGRLSVAPLSRAQWDRLHQLGGRAS